MNTKKKVHPWDKVRPPANLKSLAFSEVMRHFGDREELGKFYLVFATDVEARKMHRRFRAFLKSLKEFKPAGMCESYWNPVEGQGWDLLVKPSGNRGELEFTRCRPKAAKPEGDLEEVFYEMRKALENG